MWILAESAKKWSFITISHNANGLDLNLILQGCVVFVHFYAYGRVMVYYICFSINKTPTRMADVLVCLRLHLVSDVIYVVLSGYPLMKVTLTCVVALAPFFTMEMV